MKKKTKAFSYPLFPNNSHHNPQVIFYHDPDKIDGRVDLFTFKNIYYIT